MENINVLAIIQARVGSTRLPNKVLMPLGDKTVIEQVIERVSRSKYIDEIVVATSIEKNNLLLIKLCSEKNIRVFAGSEEDVLDRFYQVAKLIKPKHIVRITADCPLHDPYIIDSVINKHIKIKVDYTSNTDPPTYPDGLDVEVFTFGSLKIAWENAKLLSQREHVTPYIRESERFSKFNVRNDNDLSELRWTLDEQRDYDMIKQVYDNFPASSFFSFEEILELIESKPELAKINSDIIRNEGYIKSLNNDNKH